MSHAVLSPSASGRWIACPASIRAAAELPVGDVSSSYAMEGTAAHKLGEIEASYYFGLESLFNYQIQKTNWRKAAEAAGYDILEMEIHIKGYLALLQEELDSIPNSSIVLEQRMETGIPSCSGTSDATIVSPTVISVVDLKYGAGVPVSALKNSQLRLYGLGALKTFGDILGETELVRMTVYQPRLDSTSTEELSAEGLRDWRDGIIPIAELALGPDAPFNPGEKQCRWCPVSGQCRAQMEWATARDFAVEPDLLSLEEISHALTMVPAIKHWASALEETALRLAYSEQLSIPGWKIVLSGGKRIVVNAVKAIELLVANGFNHEDVTKTSLRGIGELEILLKTLPKVKSDKGRDRNARLEDLLGDLVTKTDGKPALVPEDDKRPAVSPNAEASKHFDAIGAEE